MSKAKPKFHCSVCNKLFDEPKDDKCHLCGSIYYHVADQECYSLAPKLNDTDEVQRPSGFSHSIPDATGHS